MIFQNWQAKVRPMFRAMLLVFCLSITSAAEAASNEAQKPITLKTMGSLFFGGTVTRAENGETFHGDHGYAQYYIPQNSRNYPLVMWHGIGQSGKTYESTPDGREGFMSILPRRDWPVYIIDQPRRGRTQAVDAARVSVPTTERESAAWDAFRLGVWTPPDPAYLFSTLQFPRDPATIDQFFRQQTPDTGAHPRTAEHRAFMGNTVAELFRQTGPGILITHSHSGQYGWTTAMAAPELIKAIVAYEPGQFAFPEGERPAEIPSKNDLVNEAMQPQPVPLEEFKKLTKMPILVIYGDNISKDPSTIFNVDLWRVASARAKQFVDAVNRHGGDAQLVLLPDIGMKGNTHIPFADLNNIQIAEHLEKFLQSKGLDGRNQPHNGPAPKKVEQDVGPVAPGLVQYTSDVVFHDLWLRPALAPRDRSLVTVSALIASGQVAQIPYHLNRAMDNGLTKAQASEVLTHLAFYAGWPNVFSAIPVAGCL